MEPPLCEQCTLRAIIAKEEQSMSEPIYIGISGHVVAIDRATGGEVWRTKLAGSTYVTVYSDGDGLYAGTRGKLFCIDRATGSIRWTNELTGLGYGLITFSNSGAAAAAVAEETARRAAAAAAASS
jgi:outer membrane protein assembly factor BamB